MMKKPMKLRTLDNSPAWRGRTYLVCLNLSVDTSVCIYLKNHDFGGGVHFVELGNRFGLAFGTATLIKVLQ